MKKDLRSGEIRQALIAFAGPMILGNLLQIFYNVADSIIVGRFIGPNALAAVGSAFTLMTFITSILVGLCMGSGAVFSFYYGKRDLASMRGSIQVSFLFVGIISLIVTAGSMYFTDEILLFLQIPFEIMTETKAYISIIFYGILFVFIYNYFAYLLRAVGNSTAPLAFLGIAALINVIGDVLFVVVFGWGVEGAAIATVASQFISAAGIAVYTYVWEPELRIPLRPSFDVASGKKIIYFSLAASAQQSVMNFGILLVQGLVNSFGPLVMAAFAAGVKIDAFAYMPVQEFGNAYSLFVSQNFGAGKMERIEKGTLISVKIILFYCAIVSIIVFVFAKYLMMIFIKPEFKEIIDIGVVYLRIEGVFYSGIGLLFLFYGYFRGIQRPEISLLLTGISLGTRVFLAFFLSRIPLVGVQGIWIAIPIGWILADTVGLKRMIDMDKDRKDDKDVD
ncbi:MAG: MATE family efflux transporter [Gallicola sp.]|nr:MATE family efflux transporter [Gallicola sp.]